ncbi:MAG: hypothetical protein PHV34_23575 [Verrucomicrobiae bacterium]|nr:hypothetical protein [Verrucomicrobiae bacterium]
MKATLRQIPIVWPGFSPARPSIPRSGERGGILLMVMSFLFVMIILTGSLLSWAGSERVMLSRRAGRVDALYGSEAAVRRSMAQVRKLYFENYSTNGYITGGLAAPGDSELNGLSSTTGPATVSALNSFYTFSGVSVGFTNGTSTNRYTTYAIQETDESLSAYAGLNSSRATIQCVATATSKQAGTPIPVTVKQLFNIDYIPVFQYAIFYNMDMECFNGPTMTVNGRIHCNGTLYYAPADTLKVNANLTASCDIERGIKVWKSGIDKTLSNRSATVQAAYGYSQARYQADPANWDSPSSSSEFTALGSYGTASFQVKNPKTAAYVDFKVSSGKYYDSESSGWAGGALTKWGGGVKSKDQGIEEVDPPVPTDVVAAATDPTNPYHVMIEPPSLNSDGSSAESVTTQAAKMAYNATLMIKRTGNTNLVFMLKDSYGRWHQVSDLRNSANIVATTTTTFHDQREYKQNGNYKMTVTEFDVGALYGGSTADNVGAMNSAGIWKDSSGSSIIQDSSGTTFTPVPFDGTVYVYDDRYSSSLKPAVRIKNGSTIYNKDSNTTGNNGLTIISANPVYIQGNFNSDGSISTGPEKTGSSDENCPPAMIASDVVSVLSTAWDSSKDDPGSGTFKASTYGGRTGGANTEVNAAILAGVNRSAQSVTTSSFDGTTGGVNNFMRFLENWSGTYKYSGSMVSLWYGAQSTSTYYGAGTTHGVFNAPTRDWAFNTDFLDPNKLPRVTPIIRVYTTAAWKNF